MTTMSTASLPGAFIPEAVGLDPTDAVELKGPAGSISIHHGRIVHGSALNTSDRSRRILFYEMMAADAFPIMGSMTKWDGIEDYNTRMLCGEPTLTPRLKDIPIRIPQPQPDVPISIYEIQKGLKVPRLRDHQVKIAIVGAGMIGSAAARHLSKGGPRRYAHRPRRAFRLVHAFKGAFASHYDEGRITRMNDRRPVLGAGLRRLDPAISRRDCARKRHRVLHRVRRADRRWPRLHGRGSPRPPTGWAWKASRSTPRP